jgi:hypothetical protein
MRLAKISLAFFVMMSVMFGSVACTADEGWQKGLQDGVAAAVTALIATPVQTWVKNTFPAK